MSVVLGPRQVSEVLVAFQKALYIMNVILPIARCQIVSAMTLSSFNPFLGVAGKELPS